MFEHSPRLTLPYIQPAQAQKHVTHNQAIRQIDGLIHMSVVSDALSMPPTEQKEGTCYLVPPNAQDGWQGWAYHVAIWQDAAWMFLTPKTGWRLFVSDQKKLMVYHGSTWVVWQMPIRITPLKRFRSKPRPPQPKGLQYNHTESFGPASAEAMTRQEVLFTS